MPNSRLGHVSAVAPSWMRILLAVSLVLNCLACAAGGAWLYKKTTGGGQSQSPYYAAYTSVFEDAVPEQDVDICFLGDSLTARALWSEFLPDYTVANRGIGSDASEGLLGRLDTVIAFQPETVVLMIGINDLAYDISEEEIVENVTDVLLGLKEGLPEAHVLLLSVLPAESVDESKIVSLNTRYEALTALYGWVDWLDVHNSFLDTNGRIDSSLYDADGVHLNGLGYQILIDAVRSAL